MVVVDGQGAPSLGISLPRMTSLRLAATNSYRIRCQDEHHNYSLHDAGRFRALPEEPYLCGSVRAIFTKGSPRTLTLLATFREDTHNAVQPDEYHGHNEVSGINDSSMTELIQD